MAHPVRLQINLLLLSFSLMLWSCHAPVSPVHSTYKLLNKEYSSLTMVNGLIMDNDKPFNGTLFTLFPGTIDTAELASYKEGKEHGEWRKFYSTKRLKEKRYFENGRKTGEYIAWWQNGQKQLDYFFVTDEYEGTCKEWNEAGMLNKIMNYKKGHEEGQQQWWYDNGKIRTNYIIKNGRRFGLLGTKNCINVSDSIFKN